MNQNTKRLFIGIDLPEEIKNFVERCQIGIPTARWVQKENLHLTLQFLGEISFKDYDFLRHILQKVKGKAFYMYLSSPKVFYKKQKILWLKAEPENPILELRNSIIDQLNQHKDELQNLKLNDKEKFLPHVTIARMNMVNQKKLNEYLLTFEDFSTKEFKVGNFVLFSSILKREGPIYTKEKIYELDDIP